MLVPAGHKVVVERHYEAASPGGLELVEPGETIATTKEEEWVSKKKTEVTNTKQIETRVKRQVVLEDGKVVEDTGPMVTTNTTEDTETQEHHQTELRKLGEDDAENEEPLALEEGSKDAPDSAKWIVVPNPDGLVREVKEKRVISREETEEVKETEDVQHLGDITDEDFLEAVKTGHKDLRGVLKTIDQTQTVVSTGPRLIKETTRSNKVIDTEETRESSSVRPDGRIVTETERTTEHEEIKDDELPENAPPDQDKYLENSQRYYKSKDQEEVEYIADGVKIGKEMRYKGETTEFERRGDGVDEPDWDSLSARIKRRANNTKQPHRYRDLPPTTSPMDRKDALTRRPLDFDQEEETRKMETSKWLENHFGSESRSSRDSLVEEEEPQQQPPKTSYFNVTIKSQPPRIQEQPLAQQSSYPVSHNRSPSRQEPERDRSYFQGLIFLKFNLPTPSAIIGHRVGRNPNEIGVISKEFLNGQRGGKNSIRPIEDLVRSGREHPRYKNTTDRRFSPVRERTSPETTPTPPQRKKAIERRQRISQESRYDSGYRTPSRNETRDSRDEPLEEPPPDYSPPSPPQPPVEKKHQKTRFVEPVKHKSGNIIDIQTHVRRSIKRLDSSSLSSIRVEILLVSPFGNLSGKSDRSVPKGKPDRGPNVRRRPRTRKGTLSTTTSTTITTDNNINNHHDVMDGRKRAFSPVHRYYLGEDPFGGSIYGRENKYDGVKPVRNSRKHPVRDEENNRSQSTLGRFSKSTGRLVSTSTPNNQNRFSQTLPRHSTRNEVPSKLETKSNSTINVSIINTVSPPQQRPLANGGPAKPARTYKSNLARSQSFNVQAGDLTNRRTMHKSNPQLNRLDEAPTGLKSPALISSINRSTQNLSESYEENYTNANNAHSRFARNGYSDHNNDTKKVTLKGLREKTPELFKTVHENENDWTKSSNNYNKRNYNPDIYEPPTRLSPTTASRNVIRRGSSSSNDYSETYRTTSRNDDPHRPSVTNTVQSFSKKTIPVKDGRGFQTIESTEKKSVTKSRYVGEPHNARYYESDRRYSSASPVVIEVRNNYRK
ncbi:hypothetical protein QE152_g23050 [Popillia japonica]|uniref:Uncharacterized protein n=1 Tax=Popillia japonica TaxID=7064 RepID=A0AAW1KI79_POPJA